MVCDSTNVFVDGEAGSEADVRETLHRPDRRVEGQGGRRLFRLERRAHGQHHSGGRERRSPCLPGRAVDDPHVAGRALGRSSGRHRAVRCGHRSASFSRREDPLSVHRQPGRTARGAVAHRRRQPSAMSAWARETHACSPLASFLATRSRSATCRTNSPTAACVSTPNAITPAFTFPDTLAATNSSRCINGRVRTIAVPTHGERRHLLEHAALAKDLQVPHAVAPRNGEMVRLAPGAPGIIDEVPAGRLYVDAGSSPRKTAMPCENADTPRSMAS